MGAAARKLAPCATALSHSSGAAALIRRITLALPAEPGRLPSPTSEVRRPARQRWMSAPPAQCGPASPCHSGRSCPGHRPPARGGERGELERRARQCRSSLQLRVPPPSTPHREQRQRNRGSGRRDGDGKADLAAQGLGAAACGVQRLLVQRQGAGPRAHRRHRRLLRCIAAGRRSSTIV